MSSASGPAGRRPRVTMGMPVYNGELYVEQALKSLLTQTFEDFELLISDNASTDRTTAICRDYAARDRRIKYRRNEANVGYCRNLNSVIEGATGDYFLMTHHDDVREPDYISRTIEVLDLDPSLTVCYTTTRDIDENGQVLPRVDPPLRLESANLRERFKDIIRMDHLCEADFGLTRVLVLRQTRLHGDYADSDRVLLAELLLHGPFHKISDCLFFRRAHALQSTAIAPDRKARTVWFNPAYRGKLVFPYFRELGEYWAAVGRAPIRSSDRWACRAELVKWIGPNGMRLLGDIDTAFRDLGRPYYHRLMRKGT